LHSGIIFSLLAPTLHVKQLSGEVSQTSHFTSHLENSKLLESESTAKNPYDYFLHRGGLRVLMRHVSQELAFEQVLH